jgi:hypothetical protein
MAEQEGLWAALMRRRVVRTVALYLAAAWLAIQVASLLAGIWSLPPGFVQNMFVLLMIGLPIVAALSWIYDLRDAGLVETDGAGFRKLLRKRLRKNPLRVAAAMLALTLVFLVAVAYSWPDEDLSPDAQRLLQVMAPQTDDDPQTLVLGLIGFGAPPGADIWDHGRFLLTNAAIIGIDPGQGYVNPYTVGTKDLCVLWDEGCSAKLLASLDGVPALMAANATGLERYRALRDARIFGDPTRASMDTGWPSITPLMVGQRLELMQALYDAEHGDPAAAQARVAIETAFHRRMLARSDAILPKMIAIAMLQNDIRFAVLLVERAARRPKHAASSAAPLRLTPAERSLVSVMAREGAALITLSTRADVDQEALRRIWYIGDRNALFSMLPFRRNATLNQALEVYMVAIRASVLNAKEFAALPKPKAHEPSLLGLYTNTAGEILLNDETDWLQYVERCHDLDALIVLAQVAQHLRSRGVTAAALPATLLALPPELRDPFTGQSPAWIGGKLVFARNDHKDRRGIAPELPFTPQ